MDTKAIGLTGAAAALSLAVGWALSSPGDSDRDVRQLIAGERNAGDSYVLRSDFLTPGLYRPAEGSPLWVVKQDGTLVECFGSARDRTFACSEDVDPAIRAQITEIAQETGERVPVAEAG